VTQLSTSDRAGSHIFDNDRSAASDRLRCLADVLDRFTTDRLDYAGIPEGARCLELGGGCGSIAVWMAEVSGPDGAVVATDVKPQHFQAHPRVSVVEHNLVTDALPAGPFDLIHARLLLAYLPSRRQILPRLVQALAPRGALVVEEWGAAGPAGILTSAAPDAADLYQRYHHALLAVLVAQGTDTAWCRQVPQAMLDAGLVDVDTETHARSWHGGSAGCRLPIAVFTAGWDQLVAHGADPEDLERLHDVLTDPRTVLLGDTTFSTVGRKTP
jgi:SAM-dependent methyltransferase